MPAQLQRSMMGLWCTLRLRLWLDRALGSVLLARDLAERIFLDDLDAWLNLVEIKPLTLNLVDKIAVRKRTIRGGGSSLHSGDRIWAE